MSRVHGDFTIDNLLLDADRIAGLDMWAVDTNAIYHDMATFLNSLILLRLTRPMSWAVLSQLRSAFLRGYFGSDPWDDQALTFLQRIGFVDVTLSIRRRRPSAFARALLTHLIVPAMRRLAAGPPDGS
jgi:Ser/Thr protein kinase RdoA (MazF antagonist)